MPKSKKNIKVRDQKPKEDPKGGRHGRPRVPQAGPSADRHGVRREQ